MAPINVSRARPDLLLRAGVRSVLLSTISVRTVSPLVALTFDDGPDPRLTPDVLDVLRDREVRSTFLMVADQVRQHPELARRVIAEGHEVGLHGDRHRETHGESIRGQYQALRRGRRDVEAVLGMRVKWFRAPYGKQEPESVLACHLAGMRPLMWSTSAHDWQPDTIEEQLTHLSRGLEPGAIVLLHDGAAGIAEPPPPTPQTQPELLQRVLDLMQTRSLHPVTVSDLCAAGAVVREPWFEHWLHH